MAKFFGILTVFSLAVLLPMYLSGGDIANQKYSFLTQTSFMNILTSWKKLWVAYIFTFLYAIFGLTFVFFLSRKMTSKIEENWHSETDLAERTLMIDGIPTDLHVKEVDLMIEEIFTTWFRN